MRGLTKFDQAVGTLDLKTDSSPGKIVRLKEKYHSVFRKMFCDTFHEMFSDSKDVYSSYFKDAFGLVSRDDFEYSSLILKFN